MDMTTYLLANSRINERLTSLWYNFGYPSNLIPYDFNYPGADLAAKYIEEIGATDVWTWIRQRISLAKRDGYKGIHIGDYIQFGIEGKSYKAQIAGMNTYTNCGDSTIENHIDFITENLYSESFKWNSNQSDQGYVGKISFSSSNPDLIFNQTDKGELFSGACNGVEGSYEFVFGEDSWEHAGEPVTLLVTYGISTTGTPTVGDTLVCSYINTEGSPFKSSDLYSNLNIGTVDHPESVFSKLPSTLKAKIIPKHCLAPIRYSLEEDLLSDNNSQWMNIGNLWVPFEQEVFGRQILSGSKNCIEFGTQYPIFIGRNDRFVKRLQDGSRVYWWTASAQNNSLGTACCVTDSGSLCPGDCSYDLHIPICFRIG